MKLTNLSVWTLVLIFLTPCLLSAQQIQSIPVEVTTTQAERIGTIPPVRTLIPMVPLSQEKRKRAKMNRKAPNNFAGRGKYISTVTNAQPQGPDPLRQYDFGRSANQIPIDPIVNVDGLTSNFGSPHDPTGDIGADHYLQAINATRLGVFDKEGNLIQAFNASTLWSTLGFNSAGDPIILYDQEVNRWIITEFPSGNQLLVAISDDSDPLGGYTAYNFSTPSFPDYPKYSIWNNAYVVTTNESGPGTSPAYFIDRADLLAGAATVDIQRLTLPGSSGGPGFQVDTPVDWSGLTQPPVGAHPMILSMVDDAWGGGNADAIDIYSFNIDFDNPTNTTTTVQNLKIAAFDSNPCSAEGPGFACIPQLNGNGLDGIPETIMNQTHYRNFGSHESMVLNFITDVTGGQNLSGIRWMELRRSPGETEWDVYQEGTFAPDDGLDRFMGGISMDGAGNIGLAYNVSSEEIFVGVRFTGRRASDPLGEMTVDEFIAVEGSNTINSGGRFGDYGHMSIDPVNDRTFWYTTEYAGDGGVSTRILAFELRKDTIDLGPSALITPLSDSGLSANEMVTVEIKNFGLDSQSVFRVGYIFENNPAVMEDVTFDLAPDSTYAHTFTPTVNMSTIGAYNFRTFTQLATDQAPLNDTARYVINHLPRYDTGITSLNELPNFTCESTINFMAVLSNFGTVPLTSATVTVSLNGTVVQTIAWTGNLEMGESNILDISVTDFVAGENTVLVTAFAPNGETDEVPANNGREHTFDAVLNGETVILTLNLDNFPEETTWELVDEFDTAIFTGGPYNQDGATITEEWCLDPEACYTFTIRDAFSDGICCGNSGNGNYNISNDGLVLVSGNGQFGGSQDNEFCAMFECILTANVINSNETGAGNNATILITANSGLPPYEYSIDGGATFSSGAIFQGLIAGDYEIQVRDQNDCIYQDTLVITSCVINILAEITNVSAGGNDDGQIEIFLEGGAPPFMYSIDNGVTFQSDSIFTGLTEGIYKIRVNDANNCSVIQTVTIDMAVATTTQIVGQSIKVMPNPTDGIVRIEVKGLIRPTVFLPVSVMNASGQLLHESTITRYDDTYTGLVSLVAYPAGVYYVRLQDEQITRLLKIVKQ